MSLPTPRLPDFVQLVEVGPRDGLQNESEQIATNTKVELINQLSRSGLKSIEVTSFVHPKAIPQLSDAEEVLRGINRNPQTAYPVLIPNLRGLERALSVGVKEISVFTAASETFNQRNIRCSISESLERYSPVINHAKKEGLRVRGYISTVIGCPYEGRIPPAQVAHVGRELISLGVDEISLGDTIGVGTPLQVIELLEVMLKYIPTEKLAVHFHDTYGQALANVYAALEAGITIVDTSVAGLGGCPYADGATGNVATEDVLYMLNGLGIRTGVDLQQIISAGRYICSKLNRNPMSRLANIPDQRRFSW